MIRSVRLRRLFLKLKLNNGYQQLNLSESVVFFDRFNVFNNGYATIFDRKDDDGDEQEICVY